MKDEYWFLGANKEINNEEYGTAVLKLIDKAITMITDLENFDLNHVEKGLPKITDIAVNFLDNFVLNYDRSPASQISLQNYCYLIEDVKEAYDIGIESSSFGNISRKDYTVMQPSWLEQILNRRYDLVMVLEANTEAFQAVNYKDYKYFMDKDGIPMSLPMEEVYPTHQAYLDILGAEEQKKIDRELMKRKPDGSDFA